MRRDTGPGIALSASAGPAGAAPADREPGVVRGNSRVADDAARMYAHGTVRSAHAATVEGLITTEVDQLRRFVHVGRIRSGDRYTVSVFSDQACAVFAPRTAPVVRPGPCVEADRRVPLTPLRNAADFISRYYDEEVAVGGEERVDFVHHAYSVSNIRHYLARSLPGDLSLHGVLDGNRDGLDDDARIRVQHTNGRAVCVSLPTRVGRTSHMTYGPCWKLAPRTVSYPMPAEKTWTRVFATGLATASRAANAAPAASPRQRRSTFLERLPDALRPRRVFEDTPGTVTVVPGGDKVRLTVHGYGTHRAACATLPRGTSRFSFHQVRATTPSAPGTWHRGTCRSSAPS